MNYRATSAWRHKEQLRNWLLRGIYRFGWQVAARLPPRLVAMIISAASGVALRRDGARSYSASQSGADDRSAGPQSACPRPP